MISRILALAAALALAVTPAFAANQLPTIAGPNGQVTADPVVIIGYDSGTGLPCVIGKTATCVLSAGGGGGGGGAVTVADGADVAEGAKANSVCPSDASDACSQISMEKRIAARITSMISALGSPFQAGGALGAGSALIGGVNLVDTAGTNKATVKAASTAPATTDTSLVVAISPNPALVCTSKLPINQATSTDVLTSVAKLNVCAVILISSTAQAFSVVEGTGALCATGISAVIGATTADSTHGIQSAANGGFTAISDRPWLKTGVTADHLCILQSSTGVISGVITYADAS